MTETYRARRRELLKRTEGMPYLVFDLDRTMPHGMDQVSLRYLTGYTGEGALLLAGDDAVLLIDSRYLEQAERQVPQLRRVHAESDYLDDMEPILEELGVEKLGFSSWRMTDYVVREIARRTGVEMTPFRDPVGELRVCKDEAELATLRRAAEIAEAALVKLMPSLRPGINEVDIAFEFTALMQDLGADGAAFGPTVASGPNSALPHYRPSLGRRTLESGDFLLFDFGVLVDGYISDISRTFVIGEASDKQREIYGLVNEALDAGLASLRAGVPGREVHRAASRVIEASPYADYIFLSPLGHGVGLEVHETPRMGPQMEAPLKQGTVVTVEPGIYIPGFGGVRIEEMAVVTDAGYEILSSLPRADLIELG